MTGMQDEAADSLYFEHLPMEQFVPAAGQGILAVEIRQGELAEIMKAIHSAETEAELTAEREFLTILGGGCNAPCGAHCRLDKETGKLSMHVMYAKDGVHPEYRKSAIFLYDDILKDAKNWPMTWPFWCAAGRCIWWAQVPETQDSLPKRAWTVCAGRT